jgi:hypothetical protein
LLDNSEQLTQARLVRGLSRQPSAGKIQGAKSKRTGFAHDIGTSLEDFVHQDVHQGIQHILEHEELPRKNRREIEDFLNRQSEPIRNKIVDAAHSDTRRKKMRRWLSVVALVVGTASGLILPAIVFPLGIKYGFGLQCQNSTEHRMHEAGRTWTEDLVGSAPGWIRGAILWPMMTAAVTAVFAQLTGFDSEDSTLTSLRKSMVVRHRCSCCHGARYCFSQSRFASEEGLDEPQPQLEPQPESQDRGGHEELGTALTLETNDDSDIALYECPFDDFKEQISTSPNRNRTSWILEQVQERERRRELSSPRTVPARGLLMTIFRGKGAGTREPPLRGVGWQGIVGHNLYTVLKDGEETSRTSVHASQTTWKDARQTLDLTPRQAITVAVCKLLLWHWSQPVAYIWVFYLYFCQLEPTQQLLGSVVASREIVYVASTLFAAKMCPVYLLLDVFTVWHEAAVKGRQFDGVTHLAAYFFTPHNYVSLCIANHFPQYSSIFYALGGFQIIADLAACWALSALLSQALQTTQCDIGHSGDNCNVDAQSRRPPAALVIGYVITAAGFVLFFGPMGVYSCWRVAYSRDKYEFGRSQGVCRCCGKRCLGRDGEISLYQKWRDKLLPCRSGKGKVFCCGSSLLLCGLSYIVIGVILLLVGQDVYCNGYANPTISPVSSFQPFGLNIRIPHFKQTDCGIHGKCHASKCDCDSGHSGDNCEVNDPCSGLPSACCTGESCGPHWRNCTTGSCMCAHNFAGSHCEINCGINGTANETSQKCDCAPNVAGASCQFDCGQHGSVDAANQQCVCDLGFSGSRCDIPAASAPCYRAGANCAYTLTLASPLESSASLTPLTGLYRSHATIAVTGTSQVMDVAVCNNKSTYYQVVNKSISVANSKYRTPYPDTVRECKGRELLTYQISTAIAFTLSVPMILFVVLLGIIGEQTCTERCSCIERCCENLLPSCCLSAGACFHCFCFIIEIFLAGIVVAIFWIQCAQGNSSLESAFLIAMVVVGCVGCCGSVCVCALICGEDDEDEEALSCPSVCTACCMLLVWVTCITLASIAVHSDVTYLTDIPLSGPGVQISSTGIALPYVLYQPNLSTHWEIASTSSRELGSGSWGEMVDDRPLCASTPLMRSGNCAGSPASCTGLWTAAGVVNLTGLTVRASMDSQKCFFDSECGYSPDKKPTDAFGTCDSSTHLCKCHGDTSANYFGPTCKLRCDASAGKIVDDKCVCETFKVLPPWGRTGINIAFGDDCSGSKWWVNFLYAVWCVFIWTVVIILGVVLLAVCMDYLESTSFREFLHVMKYLRNMTAFLAVLLIEFVSNKTWLVYCAIVFLFGLSAVAVYYRWTRWCLKGTFVRQGAKLTTGKVMEDPDDDGDVRVQWEDGSISEVPAYKLKLASKEHQTCFADCLKKSFKTVSLTKSSIGGFGELKISFAEPARPDEPLTV